MQVFYDEITFKLLNYNLENKFNEYFYYLCIDINIYNAPVQFCVRLQVFYKAGRSITILLLSSTQKTIAQQQWAQKSDAIYKQPKKLHNINKMSSLSIQLGDYRQILGSKLFQEQNILS